LIGGLESGQLYLVHGDGSGKSLFGIKFLIEGLKRGENGALVIRYSWEDAVQRFARLGYDCLDDLSSGRLLILEYYDDIIQQIARLSELTPVLCELEWLLGETNPQRIIFDPVGSLVAGEAGSLDARAREFAAWARSFGATVALIANGESHEIVEHFKPLVEQSFRFEVKESDDRATRFIAFEKSPDIPDQAVEVDPARGIFLLGRAKVPGPPAVVYPAVEDENAILDIQESQLAPPGDTLDANLIDLDALPDFESPGSPVEPLPDEPLKHGYEFFKPVSLPDAQSPVPDAPGSHSRDTQPLDSQHKSAPQSRELKPDKLSEMLDDLAEELSPLELDALDWNQAPTGAAFAAEDDQEAAATAASRPAEAEQSPKQQAGAQGSDIDSVITARAVEILLRPPDSRAELASGASPAAAGAAHASSHAATSATEAVNPKDFNVLVIDDNPASCEQIAQALGEYTVEIVHDGVSGLAKLISFKPDLVIIDVDLPIIDGFKVLAHIRTSLNMPIIVMSGSHMRASDRVRSTDLGADYYLTKPFSVKELRQKVRQLIARHRGISSWIINSPGIESRAIAYNQERGEHDAGRSAAHLHASLASGGGHFTSYEDFVARVEKNVRTALDNNSSFSIVGCRLPNMTAYGGLVAIHLYELVSTLVRDSDLISTNQRNDLVILLADADAAGARAFITRLRDRVIEEVNQEPSVWMRSFPDLEEAVESTPHDHSSSNGSSLNRRASDRQAQEGGVNLGPFITSADPQAAGPTDVADGPTSTEPYIDLLKHL
jgi:DNA-binding response OmpR family regulator/KaiC/GvpD/RAD55 family RecA-like ATPase